MTACSQGGGLCGHLVADTFPSPSTISNAYGAAKAAIEANHKCAEQFGFDGNSGIAP